MFRVNNIRSGRIEAVKCEQLLGAYSGSSTTYRVSQYSIRLQKYVLPIQPAATMWPSEPIRWRMLPASMSNENIAIGSRSLMNSNFYNIGIGTSAPQQSTARRMSLGIQGVHFTNTTRARANIAIGHYTLSRQYDRVGISVWLHTDNNKRVITILLYGECRV